MEDMPLVPFSAMWEINQTKVASFTALQGRTELVLWLQSFWRCFGAFWILWFRHWLWFQLAGVEDEFISKDYALTRVGREPAREKIMARLSKEPLFASNNEAALNMFTCRQVIPLSQILKRLTRDESHETMQAFLEHFDKKYGGVDEYVKRYVGFSDEEIAVIKRNLLIPGTSRLWRSHSQDYHSSIYEINCTILDMNKPQWMGKFINT